MTEKIFLLEHADPVIFYGTNEENLHLIKNLFPKIKIVARGNAIKAMGEETDISVFGEVLNSLESFCSKYNSLTEEVIVDYIKGKTPAGTSEVDDLIIYGVSGKPIIARTHSQRDLVKAYDKHDLVFAIGPAGSGKTYTAIALAVKALKNKEVRRIILSRPAVEAGEKLGFLPGDMKEKIDPYLQPLYDALEDMIPVMKLKEYLEDNIIQIAPLAFMRGRTLGDAFIILDEAQNTTTNQIKMFLTRMGMNSKMVVTGDMSQIDLPPTQRSGLVDALGVLHGVKGIAKIEFDVKDIVRHKLVQRIVEAYDKADVVAKEERQRRLAEKKDAVIK
jgi:phosphate starvation-inducible PhoH-like protein